MDYQELIRLSTKGDKQALEDLFKLGETLLINGNFEEASKVFKESAISYRISTSRNFSRAVEADSKADWAKEEVELIKHWIDLNPKGLSTIPRKVEYMNTELLLEILGDHIWPKCNPEEEFHGLMTLLETSLDEIDGKDLPANSPFRRVFGLMNEYYGIGNPSIFNYLNNPTVHIYADLLAYEIEKRSLTLTCNQ